MSNDKSTHRNSSRKLWSPVFQVTFPQETLPFPTSEVSIYANQLYNTLNCCLKITVWNILHNVFCKLLTKVSRVFLFCWIKLHYLHNYCCIVSHFLSWLQIFNLNTHDALEQVTLNSEQRGSKELPNSAKSTLNVAVKPVLCKWKEIRGRQLPQQFPVPLYSYLSSSFSFHLLIYWVNRCPWG